MNFKFTAIIALLVFTVNSQESVKKTQLDSIKEAFYLKNGPENSKEIDGIHAKFNRWSNYWESRLDENGNFPNASDVLKTMQKEVSNADAKSLGGNWMPMGPNTTPSGSNGIGRINCMEFDPTNPNKYWIGTPAGGLWLTTDNGATWTPKTDNLPVLGVSDIAIVQAHPDTMYIASGDALFGSTFTFNYTGNGDSKSLGVLKSVDGGNTWNATGLSFLTNQNRQIKRLLIDPINSNNLLACTTVGIYKTVDAGANWVLVTANVHFMDAEYALGNSQIVYATSFNFSTGSRFYKSINGGSTWTLIRSFSSAVRVKIGLTPQDTSRVDLVAAAVNTFALEGIYRSYDFGNTFNTVTPVNCQLNNYLGFYPDSCTGQGYYTLSFVIDPTDSLHMWIGGVDNYESTNGGISFDQMSTWWLLWPGNPQNVQEMHADKHFYRYHPLNPTIVFSGNDGGIYYKVGTNPWTDISNGLQIGEIYRIAVDKTRPNRVTIGQQDNGTKMLENGVWRNISGGDGMESAYDGVNSDIQITSLQNGRFFQTQNNWVDSMRLHENPEGQWLMPIASDPLVSGTFYTASTSVYKMENNIDLWTQISPEWFTNIDIEHIVISPTNNQVIYVAGTSKFHATFDGGLSWSTVNSPGTSITGVSINPDNDMEVWISLGSYASPTKRVYKSINGGATWINKTDNLNNLPINCITIQKGGANTVYIGNDVGVYYRDSTMNSWVPFDAGLPNCPVAELEIDLNANKIWAGTFGRGLWVSDLYTPSLAAINELNFETFIDLFPTITDNKITIRNSSTKFKNYTVTIYDSQGKIMKQTTEVSSFTYEIEVKHFDSGIYFARFESEGKSMVKRFVVR